MLDYKFIEYLKKRNKIWKQKDIDNVIPVYDDTILYQYKFTNIWRELDTFSKQEINRIRKKSLIDQILIIAIGRHSINWKTTDLLMDGIKYKELFDYWQECKRNGEQFVSDAILLQAPKGSNRAKLLIKHRDRVFAKAEKLEAYIGQENNGKKILEKINKLFGCGPFRSYEIYTSLTYSEHVYFEENDVLHIGPGSLNGFKAVYGNYMNEKYINKVIDVLIEEIKEILLSIDDFYWIAPKLQGSFNKKQTYKFTYRTLEDCMCEYRKYINLSNGSGRGRLYKSLRKDGSQVELPF